MKRSARICSRGLPALLAGLTVVLAGCTTTGQTTRSTPQPERAAQLNMELAADYLRKGELQMAKDKIDRSLEQDPRNAQTHLVAAMLYDRLKDQDKADDHFERAISLDAQDPEIRNNYAVYLCQSGRYEKGAKLALEAAANPLYKTPEFGFVNAGNCMQNAGDLKRAEESYRRALSVRPRFGAALFQMAETEYQQKEFMSARAFLERYLAVGRTTPETLWLGHRIERDLGNEAQAMHYAQRLKSEYPGAAQTRRLLESERNPG